MFDHHDGLMPGLSFTDLLLDGPGRVRKTAKKNACLPSTGHARSTSRMAGLGFSLGGLPRFGTMGTMPDL